MATGEQLFNQLDHLQGSKTVIVGIGNLLKGDDGIGPLICRQLRDAKICAELIDAGTVPENYIQPIIKKAPQNLLIIDAIDFGASPGMVSVFRPEQLNSFVFSTHTLSPGLFIDVICRQIELDIYVIGVQPEKIQLGQSISASVKEAVQLIVNCLISIFPPVK